MPTYDYLCTKCGNEFQEFQKITARPGAKCPKCGGKSERQLSGGAGLVFKGSGFYLTDYGRNAHRKSGPAESKTDSGGDSKSEAKSETKSEAKGESKPEKTPEARPSESRPSKKKAD